MVSVKTKVAAYVVESYYEEDFRGACDRGTPWNGLRVLIVRFSTIEDAEDWSMAKATFFQNGKLTPKERRVLIPPRGFVEPVPCEVAYLEKVCEYHSPLKFRSSGV